MTRRPPDPLPDPALVLKDGTVIPGAEVVEAWHRAYLGHRARLREEARRYAAECARLKELFGPPAGSRGQAQRSAAWHLAWYQADLDEAAGEPLGDDEAMFSSPSGEWFAADARFFLPPCEMEG